MINSPLTVEVEGKSLVHFSLWWMFFVLWSWSVERSRTICQRPSYVWWCNVCSTCTKCWFDWCVQTLNTDKYIWLRHCSVISSSLHGRVFISQLGKLLQIQRISPRGANEHTHMGSNHFGNREKSSCDLDSFFFFPKKNTLKIIYI